MEEPPALYAFKKKYFGRFGHQFILWLVSALCEIGELERARELCEKLISHASPLGLYAEEIEPRTGRHLGNFPQAFTHLALINAVMHIIRAEHGEHDPASAIATVLR